MLISVHKFLFSSGTILTILLNFFKNIILTPYCYICHKNDVNNAYVCVFKNVFQCQVRDAWREGVHLLKALPDSKYTRWPTLIHSDGNELLSNRQVPNNNERPNLMDDHSDDVILCHAERRSNDSRPIK